MGAVYAFVVVVVVVINVVDDVFFSVAFRLDWRFSLTTPTTRGSDAAKLHRIHM